MSVLKCMQSTVLRRMADTQPAQAAAEQNRSIAVRPLTRCWYNRKFTFDIDVLV